MKLPIVQINGKAYYVDERLGELRAVDNPHDTMTIVEAGIAIQLAKQQKENEP